jgi:uncharacterized protein YjbI with pentapeptide repeats
MQELDRQKTRAELAKINEEILKTKVDRQRAEADLAHQQTLFRLEFVRVAGTIATFVVACVGVFTLLWNVHTYRLDSDRKVSEHISNLLKDLDKAPSVRAASIVSLLPHINDSDVGPSILLTLTYMIGVEDERSVQSAIVRTLKGAGQKAVPMLRDARARIVSEVEPAFTWLQNLDDQREKDKAAANALYDKRQNIEAQIKRRQQGLMAIAFALRDLTCTRPSLASCPIDFSGLPFKQMDFVGVQGIAPRSSFRGAILWHADLFGVDLKGADFTDAFLNEADLTKTNLTGAVFDKAHLQRVVKRPGQHRPARFADADLTGARFSGACLGGADFQNAQGLAVEQFKDAFAAGATFKPDFESKLKAAGYIKSDPNCVEY